MPWLRVNQTRLCWLRAVPTPVFALEVQRGGIPGQPGAYLMVESLMKISSLGRMKNESSPARGRHASQIYGSLNSQKPNLQEIDCLVPNLSRERHQNIRAPKQCRSCNHYRPPWASESVGHVHTEDSQIPASTDAMHGSSPESR